MFTFSDLAISPHTFSVILIISLSLNVFETSLLAFPMALLILSLLNTTSLPSLFTTYCIHLSPSHYILCLFLIIPLYIIHLKAQLYPHIIPLNNLYLLIFNFLSFSKKILIYDIMLYFYLHTLI